MNSERYRALSDKISRVVFGASSETKKKGRQQGDVYPEDFTSEELDAIRNDPAFHWAANPQRWNNGRKLRDNTDEYGIVERVSRPTEDEAIRNVHRCAESCARLTGEYTTGVRVRDDLNDELDLPMSFQRQSTLIRDEVRVQSLLYHLLNMRQANQLFNLVNQGRIIIRVEDEVPFAIASIYYGDTILIIDDSADTDYEW